MEEAQALDRAHRALKQDAIIEKWWLNKMREIRRDNEVARSIDEDGSTKA
jgi:hypothetical protein|uniref:Uncharacterized protein n=1 Tax=Picea glauca TaxID=3330 RepID=A0A101M539_PICGL|nr:hypothetical protein ABT39_MTgene1103 [Picea glauca]